jgi:uncharacterized protein YjiS (DUF1127 family)
MSHAANNVVAAEQVAGSASAAKAAGLIMQVVEWYRERRRVKRTMDALSQLSDRTLADIGIHRSEIPRVARDSRDGLHVHL